MIRSPINADIVKTFDNLLPGETSLAFGAEYRDESFRIEAGEEASYIQGPFPGAAGSQVFPGFTPSSEVDEGRDAASLYGEVEWVPNDKTLISAALRYEDYSDFGDAVTGKLAGRYDFTDQGRGSRCDLHRFPRTKPAAAILHGDLNQLH